MLLRYFGERGALPCQQCDNCRVQRHNAFPDTLYYAYLDMVAELLSDGNPHPVEELHILRIPTEHLRPFLTRIVSEEQFTLCDGMIKRR
jgi:ATP-dependent DNA helicase RecQ